MLGHNRFVPSSRAAFRRRLDKDNRRWALFLIAAASLTEFSLAIRPRLSSFENSPAILVVLPFLMMVPFVGTVCLLAHSQLLRWTGRWLGGRATARDLHATQAWSLLPVAACMPIAVLPLLLACAKATSMSPAPGIEDVLDASDLFVPVVAVLAGIWSVGRYVIYLSEAQKFSKLRAVMNHIGTAFVLLAAAAGIVLVARLVG